MADAEIQGAKRRAKPWKTTTADQAALRAPDLVNRDFTATAPNRLWVSDFTYLRCWEGRAFFSFVIDVFSCMIVGWHLASDMRDTLVLDALGMALGTREHGADVSWSRTQTPARNTRQASTPRRLTIISCSRPSAPSATAMTTRRPNRSSIPTKPS
jgi:transposase InsO family protein